MATPLDPTRPGVLVDEQLATARPRSSRQPTRSVRARLLHSRSFLIGTAVIVFWALDAILFPILSPIDPQGIRPGDEFANPSLAHLLGTDWLGRDVLGRVLAGAASVMLVAPLSTALAIVLGTTIGLVMAYYRGWTDVLLLRVVDALMSFPGLIIAVLILAVVGRSELNLILVIGITFTPLVARTVRSVVLVEREQGYVAAARLRGESGLHVMAVEVLPNILGPIAVEATLRVAYAIFASAGLSFLSLGLSEPSPDWGLTVANGRQYLEDSPWICLGPAVALGSLVIAVNLVADALKQELDR